MSFVRIIIRNLPMAINTYHSELEVNLQSASFENFLTSKKYALG